MVSQYSNLLSPMAVDSVLKVLDPARPELYASIPWCTSQGAPHVLPTARRAKLLSICMPCAYRMINERKIDTQYRWAQP